MNEKLDLIKLEVNSFINIEDGSIIESDGITCIEDVIDYVNEKFNCNIQIKNVGGFCSPGYDVECYAWAGIIDGELYFDSLEIRSC